ncbi:hypothetical protein [Gilliamella sp. Bif1-4]|jgi:hypothetical protein|uniref:hypothetical protein n=1 Tax=Gilliamella sp. Bif1-4 TaxID=3120233 RepID=UPI00080EE743|nr:hypothetical protein [Gilliamella apicola]OCG39173.1 hypothetical protein A9G25_11520 [Gilliamella apicola]
MSKFICKCGHVMHLSDSDNDYEYSFIAEKIIDEIIWILEKNHNQIDVDDFILKVDSKRIRVLVCTKCSRFWLENDDGTYKSYVLEK